MKVTRLFFFCALILSVSTACEQPTLEEDVDDVCECLRNAENGKDQDKCHAMMQKITDKYAFDKDAADDIKKRLSECVPK